MSVASIVEDWHNWAWRNAEAWGQGLEPGAGDGSGELRAGAGAGLLMSLIGPCPRINSSLAAQMGGRC